MAPWKWGFYGATVLQGLPLFIVALDCHSKMELTYWKTILALKLFHWISVGHLPTRVITDLSVHDLHRASDQRASFDAVQSIPNLASFLDKLIHQQANEIGPLRCCPGGQPKLRVAIEAVDVISSR
jgi:hypothetical protein